MKANVRLALLLGLSMYVSLYFVPYTGNALGFLPGDEASWLTITTLAFGAAVALAPWLGSRATVTALAIPAGTVVAYGELRGPHGAGATISIAELLIVMAALAALSGGPVRLPRSLLFLPGAVPLALVGGRLQAGRHLLGPEVESNLELGAILLLAVIAVCWLATDARPAFALCFAVLLQGVTSTVSEFGFPGSLPVISGLEFLLVEFAIMLPVLLPAAWLLLHRQKAPSPHLFP